MWVIETEGDIFKGKRRWLRPGTRFIFGRTKENPDAEDEIVVLNKSISRKHLTIEVGDVAPEACGKQHIRSTVTLTDNETKIGTTLNGKTITNAKGKRDSHVLQADTNIVTMGKYEFPFRINWVPMNITFSYASKESKADPWTRLYSLLGPLDVKVLREYEVGVTTHLAAKKRNTARGLQALIEGKIIVDIGTYVDALVKAGTRSNGQSPLERDYDGNLPDPSKFLPAKGDEPTQRDAAAYAPDPSRKEMFSGYMFIFYEKHQYNSLAKPINLGGGKALFREIVPGDTAVEDFVRFVKTTAGEKGLGELEDGSEGKGVVVVRFNPSEGSGKEWYTEFGKQVSIHLDHRFIEQNEFLDAILGSKASVLRKPLREESFVGTMPSFRTENSTSMLRSSQSFATSSTAAAQSSSSMAPPRGRRRAAIPKFKGFDDDDDDDVVSFVPSSSTVPEAMDIDAVPAESIEPESQGLFVSQPQSQGMFVTQNSQPLTPPSHEDMEAVIETMKSPTPPPVRNTRKRAAPSASESFMDEMAPAAAQAKKRKIAAETTRRQRGTISPPPKAITPPKAPEPVVVEKPRKRVVIKPVDEDFMEKVRSKQQLLKQAAAEEREALEQSLEDLDISEIRRKIQIGSMAIGRTDLPPQPAARADESERWDDKWNGRKNFKKFKRRGGENQTPHRKILLKVTEAGKRDFGIGDGYWLDEEKDSKKKKGKGKASQSQWKKKVPMRYSDEETDDDGLLEAGIMKPVTKKSVAVAKTKKAQASRDLFENALTMTTGGTKRPAEKALVKEKPVKKARVREETEEEEEDSDEDGLAFKRKR